jgi:hypothetical protein
MPILLSQGAAEPISTAGWSLMPMEQLRRVAGEAQVRQGLLSAVTEHSRKRDYCTWRW